MAETQAALTDYKRALRRARLAASGDTTLASSSPIVNEVSDVIPTSSDPHVDVTLSDGRGARIHLTTPQFEVRGEAAPANAPTENWTLESR